MLNLKSLVICCIVFSGLVLIALYYKSNKHYESALLESDQYSFNINSLKAKLREQENLISKLKKQTDDWQKKNQQDQFQLAQYKDQHDELKSTKMKYKQELDKIKANYLALIKQNNDTKKEIDDEIIKKYETEIKNLKEERNKLLVAAKKKIPNLNAAKDFDPLKHPDNSKTNEQQSDKLSAAVIKSLEPNPNGNAKSHEEKEKWEQSVHKGIQMNAAKVESPNQVPQNMARPMDENEKLKEQHNKMANYIKDNEKYLNPKLVRKFNMDYDNVRRHQRSPDVK